MKKFIFYAVMKVWLKKTKHYKNNIKKATFK